MKLAPLDLDFNVYFDNKENERPNDAKSTVNMSE